VGDLFNRTKTDRPTIAVTGSAGKTTAKVMIAAILRTKWVVFETKDYWNTTEHTQKHKDMILPIHRAAVLEYGMAYPGVIRKHCQIIQPNFAVITNIGMAHVGNFDGDIKGVAKAKSEIIHGMKQDGHLFLNKDDQNSNLLETKTFKGKIVTVGIDCEADYQAIRVDYVEKGMEFTINLHGKDCRFFIPVFGKHNVYNALFAIAIADLLGFSSREMCKGLEQIKITSRRLVMNHLKDGITVIDDTVHAHPAAMKAALEVLSSVGKNRNIVVFGRMPELGEQMITAHREIGTFIAAQKVDWLFTYGNNADEYGIGAEEAGFPSNRIVHYPNYTREEFHKELIKHIEPGTTILIKGASRLNMFDTVKYLKEYYQDE
jgi:UDP-N-acetylmuramoyl-tripeptide--D-alanyl-D-alanine ligase